MFKVELANLVMSAHDGVRSHCVCYNAAMLIVAVVSDLRAALLRARAQQTIPHTMSQESDDSMPAETHF